MDTKPAIPLSEALAAAQDWWREAGVDCDFVDEPHNWLAAPEPVTEAAAPPVATAIELPEKPELPPLGGDRAAWPRSLAEFAPWWLSEPSLAAAGTGQRIPPRGAAGAKLMILVAMPEAGNSQALLSGPHGQLVSAMRGAMGLAEEETYLASALPCHAKHPDWTMLVARGFDDIVKHHIALAAPQRILVLGREILHSFSARSGARRCKSAANRA